MGGLEGWHQARRRVWNSGLASLERGGSSVGEGVGGAAPAVEGGQVSGRKARSVFRQARTLILSLTEPPFSHVPLKTVRA